MPIVFNPGAFESRHLQQQAADRAPDAMEFALAKAKLEGFKEAREIEKKRLGLAEQDQAMQVEDRNATMEAAQATVDYKQAQAPRDERRKGLRIGGNTKDPLGLTQGASVGMAQSDQQEETGQVQRILGGMKDPRAKQAFIQDVTADRQQRTIAQGLTSVRDRLQDRLVGLASDPGKNPFAPDAAAFAPEFEKLAAELDQINEQTDPKLAAAIIDDVGRREDQYTKEMYETSLWKQRQGAAIAMVQQMAAEYPPDHPMQERLRTIGLAATLGDIEPQDVMDTLKAEESGRTPVEIFGLGKVWMTSEQAMKYQNEQADNLRAAAAEGFRRKRDDARLKETERHNRATEETAKGKNGEKGPNVSRGLRGGTAGERQKIADALMLEDDDLSFKDAWAQAGEMMKENTRAQMGELGGGVVPGVKDKPKGDAFLEAMTPAKRAEYDALSPELQKRIREKAGGG